MVTVPRMDTYLNLYMKLFGSAPIYTCIPTPEIPVPEIASGLFLFPSSSIGRLLDTTAT
jgi:hypothetical protein